MKNGMVYLIGAGPGDPGLITVRGKECISLADVVIYDYLANGDLLKLARPDAELIYAGKVGGAHNHAQSLINEMLVEKAGGGKTVARLKGGDPFVFGRGGEECEALVDAGIPFEVIPGVTAAIGAAAYAGIPLTHRHVTTSVAFVTGHEHPDKESSAIDWEKLSLGSGTVVFYMGVKTLPQIAANLMKNGRSPDTPVALIRWGTRTDQEVMTGNLGNIADRAGKAGFRAPAITVVGEVVSLREKLRWFDKRPLFGRTILVTRAADQAGEFSSLLSNLGARTIECPTITLVRPDSPAELNAAIDELSSYDWLILTSGNAVRHFFGRLFERGLDVRALASCKIAAVGPKSAAAVREYSIVPDLVPEDYKAEGVVAEFGRLDISGKRILFPRADKARDLIPSALSDMGAIVVSPVAYCNQIPESIPQEALLALEEKRIDCVTFTASSTVRNLAAMLGENRFLRLLDGVTVASIGSITTRTCLELGLNVDIEPGKYTLEKLTDEIVRFFSR